MEESKLAVLTDAKNEYTIQLVNILKSSICNGIRYLYDESKKKCVAENRFNEVLSEFQDYLSQIRLWSQDMIENEYKRIEIESGCDFIKELLVAVFMSHTQILQIINKEQNKKQTQIDIPKPDHFIHKCYINIGREFYKNPILFYDGPEISPIERHKNIPQSENLIATTINETIRQLLPVRKILKKYLQDAYNIEQEDEEDNEETNTPHEKHSLTKNSQANLREIVKKEAENYNALDTDTFQETSSTIPETISTPTSQQTENELEEQKLNISLEIKPEVESPIIENKPEETSTHEQEPQQQPEQYINGDGVEELPELSMEYIEDAISKQEYVSESEDDIEVRKEKEEIKKTLIETIDLEEVKAATEPILETQASTLSNTPVARPPTTVPTKPQSPTHITTPTPSSNLERQEIKVLEKLIETDKSEIKHVEMIFEDKQTKQKKQKPEEQAITVQRDIPTPTTAPTTTAALTPATTILQAPQQKSEDLALFDPTMEFEELDLTEGDALDDLVPTQTLSQTLSEPIFKPTSAHKFKFFS
jgi:hypothetical protein